jgi:succinate dehydrogenase/fumarate reductase flavoprotein subunit
MADDGRDKSTTKTPVVTAEDGMAGLDAAAKPHVVIVGGGIAGLTAAFCLRHDPVRVTVLEASSRLAALAACEVADQVRTWLNNNKEKDGTS